MVSWSCGCNSKKESTNREGTLGCNEGFEESVESDVELLEDKWRRKVIYAWRMDLDVKLDENCFDEEDDVVSDKEDKDEECEGNDGLSLSSSSFGSKDSDGDNDDDSSDSDSS